MIVVAAVCLLEDPSNRVSPNTEAPMIYKPILLLTALAMAAGCEISDGDRCPDGYDWDAEVKACLEQDTDTGPDGDTDTDDPDAGTDGGDSDGLGEECFSDDECAGFDADHCVLNPLAPSDPGYCSYEGCDTEDDDCPSPYICCDCTGLGIEDTSCVTLTDAETVQLYGCVCSS